MSIEDFIISRRSPGGSVRKAGKGSGLLPLRLVLKRAARRGLIPASPMVDVEWRGAARVDDVDPFTGRELRAIVTKAERLAPDFATLCCCGYSPGFEPARWRRSSGRISTSTAGL
jgi:hypothetical protein